MRSPKDLRIYLLHIVRAALHLDYGRKGFIENRTYRSL